MAYDQRNLFSPEMDVHGSVTVSHWPGKPKIWVRVLVTSTHIFLVIPTLDVNISTTNGGKSTLSRRLRLRRTWYLSKFMSKRGTGSIPVVGEDVLMANVPRIRKRKTNMQPPGDR